MRLLPLFLLLLATASFAQGYVLSPDGNYVSWETAHALVNCTAVSHGLITQEQVCDFTYKGASAITINASFVFNAAEGARPRAAYLWQNISHTVYVPTPTPINHSITITPKSVTATSKPCEWGAGAIKRNATLQNGSVITSKIYCFDSYVNNSGTYTLYSVWNETRQQPATQYFYDWNSVSDKFSMWAFGGFKVGTAEASWTPGQTRRLKIVYDTAPSTSGKFDIYFHLGSAQDARDDPSLVKLALDPWWNITFDSYRETLIINSQAATDYSFNLTAPISTGAETRFTTNASGTETECNGYWMVTNGTLPANTWVLNCSLASGTTAIRMYYNNNSAVPDNRNISKACKFGDHFDWTDTPSYWSADAGVTTSKSTSVLTINGDISYAGIQELLVNLTTNSILWSYENLTLGIHEGQWGAAFRLSSGNNRIEQYYTGAAYNLYTSSAGTGSGSAFTYASINSFVIREIYWNLSRAELRLENVSRINKTTNIPVIALPVSLRDSGISPWSIDWVCAFDDLTNASFSFGAWGAETNYTAPGADFVHATLTSPANATNFTFAELPINLTFVCNGTYAAYSALVFINDTNVANVSATNDTTTNYTHTPASTGTFNWSVNCTNSTMTNGSAVWDFTYVPSVSVIIYSPSNISYNTSPTSINATCNGSSASWYMTVDSEGNIVSANISVLNGVPYAIFNPIAATGTHSIDIECRNGSLINMSAVTWTVPIPTVSTQASENLLIASALLCLATLGILIYLHFKSSDPFFRALWLTGIFLVLTYSFVNEQFAFTTDLTASSTPLVNLGIASLAIVQGLIAGFVLLACYMTFELFMMIGHYLWDWIKKIQGVAE